MTFEGIPRPGQVAPGTDPLSPYLAAHEAKTERKQRPQVKKTERDESSTAVHKELPQYADEEDEQEQQTLSDEEAEEILLFAKMRGIMNVALEKGTKYKFQINPENGMVDLRDANTGKHVLSMTPSELMQISGKIERYAGVLTDRAG